MKIAVESGDTTAVRQMIIDDHIDVNADISPVSALYIVNKQHYIY